MAALSEDLYAQAVSGEGEDALDGRTTIILDSGETIAIEGEEVVIEGRKRQSQAAQVVVDGDEAASTAGVQGDALKAVRTLGGVARTKAGSQGLSVWGAAPSDTKLYVDDIPIPRLFHLGGSRSLLPSHEIGSIRLTPGGASARFGRAIGGAVEVRSAEPGQKPVEFLVHLDPFDVGLHASSRLQEDTWVSLSTRASLLSDTLGAVAPDRAEELIPIPDTLDFQARAGHVLANGDTLRLLAIGSSDHLKRGVPSLQIDQSFSEFSSSEFWRAGISLERDSDRASRKATFWVGADRDRQDLVFDDISAFGQSAKKSAGMLLVQDTKLGKHAELTLGADAQFVRSTFSRQGALTLPSREGDVFVFGQRPGDRENADQWQVDVANLGLFATFEITPLEWIRLEAGLRFEPSIVRGNRVLPARPSEPEVGYSELQVAADPRFGLDLQVHSLWQFYAAGGRYQQLASAGDLSPVFGSPVLAASKAWQALVGIRGNPFSSLAVEAVVFTARQKELTVRSALATPAIAGLLRSSGEGENMGAQVSVRADFGEGVHGSLSYSEMRARRRAESSEPWRRFDADQRHVLRMAGQWKFESGLSLGARYELSSGLPRTAVVDSVFNTRSQSFDPIFGAHNGSELRYFSEVSARVAYEQEYSWGELLVWLDALNIANRSNEEEVFYSSDFSSQGSVLGLPVLAVVGLELRL